MSEKHTELEYYFTPEIDERSCSARFRHSGWAVTRRRVWHALKRTNQSNSRLRSFGECGSYAWLEQSNKDTTKFRSRQNNCHDRLCTPCANARSIKMRDALLSLIGSKPVSFITLTLCGKGEQLNDLVDRIFKHFRALRLHPLWADNVTGGAAFLEIKHNTKSNRWHPHLHIIADAKFIPQGELSTVWRTISHDSFIVDVRRVKNPDITGHYVTKYASKPLNSSFSNDAPLLDEAVIALKGRRLCTCFGSWFGTALNSIEEAELELDPVDVDTFHFFADLESILKRANSGERDAIAILKLAGAESLWRASLNSS